MMEIIYTKPLGHVMLDKESLFITCRVVEML